MTRRTWLFMIIAAVLGAVAGLIYVFVFDPLCMYPAAIAGPGGCQHDEVFGWQPGSLAVPIWTVIGLLGGGLVGWIAAGPMTCVRWLLIAVAAAVGLIAYFAWVYTPDPRFDF